MSKAIPKFETNFLQSCFISQFKGNKDAAQSLVSENTTKLRIPFKESLRKQSVGKIKNAHETVSTELFLLKRTKLIEKAKHIEELYSNIDGIMSFIKCI